MFATQELADIDRAARGLRDQLLGDAAVKIIHRQDVPDSALDRSTAGRAPSRSGSDTIQTGGGLLGRYDTRRGSRRQVERFVIHPNQIKRLTTGEAILITKSRRRRRARCASGHPSARGASWGDRTWGVGAAFAATLPKPLAVM